VATLRMTRVTHAAARCDGPRGAFARARASAAIAQ
jgi:hypothetical protein